MKLSIAVATVLSSQTFPLISEAKLSTWSPHDKQQWREKKTKDGDQRVAVTSLATTRTQHRGGGGRRPSQQTHGRISQRSHPLSQQRMRMRKKLMEKSNELVNSRSGGRKTRSIFCDPSSSDPDVGVLSCGKGKKCIPSKTSSLGGRCKKVMDGGKIYSDLKNLPGGTDENNPKSVECVPFVSSNGAADVGVLGCGVNEICIESMDSGLGGLCTTSVADRQLEDYWCNVCGPDGKIPYRTYDVMVDVPILGTATCKEVRQAADYDLLFDEETCATVKENIYDACCMSLDDLPEPCRVCDLGYWITPERWNETVTVPGLGEYTCSIVDTEVYFGPPVYDYQDTCIAFQQDIVRSTCCDFNFCAICDENSSMVNPDVVVDVPSLGSTTCGEVLWEYFDYDKETCSVVRDSIAESCCTATDTIKLACFVCDREGYKIVGEQLNQTVTVPGLGSYACSDIVMQAYGPEGVNSSICTAFQDDIVQSTCCSFFSTCSVCPLFSYASYSTDNFVTFTDPISDTEVTKSCAEIQYDSYASGNITNEMCSTLQQDTTVSQTCCGLFGIDFEPIQCSICGGEGGVLFPEATFTRVEVGDTASCAIIGEYGERGYLNEEECQYYTSVATSCCVTPNSDNPPTVSPLTNVTTTTGNETTAISNGTATPNSGVGSVVSPLITTGMLMMSGVSYLLTWN